MGRELGVYFAGVRSAVCIVDQCLAQYRAEHPGVSDAELLQYVGELLAGLRKWIATHDAMDTGRLLAGGRPGRAD